MNTGRGRSWPFTTAAACPASAPATRSRWISLGARTRPPCDEDGSCTWRTFDCLCTRNSSPCIAFSARPSVSGRRRGPPAATAADAAALVGPPAAVSSPKGEGTERGRCIFAAVPRLAEPPTTPASWRNSWPLFARVSTTSWFFGAPPVYAQTNSVSLWVYVNFVDLLSARGRAMLLFCWSCSDLCRLAKEALIGARRLFEISKAAVARGRKGVLLDMP